jgi:hypothetical protein
VPLLPPSAPTGVPATMPAAMWVGTGDDAAAAAVLLSRPHVHGCCWGAAWAGAAAATAAALMGAAGVRCP